MTPLGDVEKSLKHLCAAGIKLAIVTNDTEALTWAHLQTLGWEKYFASVITASSGHDTPLLRGTSLLIEG